MIQEIIILSNTGIPLFCHNFQENLSNNYNYQLIASYFDQICRFTKYGFKESLNTLKMDKSVFYFYTHPQSHFHLILKCESKIDQNKFKKKSIDKIAEEIFEKFLNKFKTELRNFNGNVALFKSFSEDIAQMVKPKGILRNLVLNPF
ncbi:MAG: hypothetical protein ACFFD5_10675 [Candidatus Thorarchaeota archaeon]